MKSRWKQPMPGDVFGSGSEWTLCLAFDPQAMKRFCARLEEIQKGGPANFWLRPKSTRVQRAGNLVLETVDTLGRKVEISTFAHRSVG